MPTIDWEKHETEYNRNYDPHGSDELFCNECEAINVGFCICGEPNVGEGEL